MAKKSMIAREKKREALVKKYASKRAALKAIISDETKPMEERFRATLDLAKLPRNSSAVRLHNRCQLTGRPHAYYRKLKISRIALRDLGSAGQIPGMVKSSWEGSILDDRSYRRYADTHPQQPTSRQIHSHDTSFQAARMGARCAGRRRLHPRL
jgi:small subunit ribosomal protein S14